MSLAQLDQCLRGTLTEKVKVKILIGKVFEKAKYDYKKHPYWSKFFEKYPVNTMVTIKELLDYPDFKSPEWMVMYGEANKLSFNKKPNDKTILVGCSFGLLDISTKDKCELIRPDYVYLEVME